MPVLLSFAQAASAAAPEQPTLMVSLLPFVLIFGIFFFFVIRPQQRRMKEHQQMIGSLRRGDKVLTGGGIIGTVARLEGDDTVQVEIAPEVVVKVARHTLSNVITRTAPAANDTGAADGETKRRLKAGKPVANDNSGEAGR